MATRAGQVKRTERRPVQGEHWSWSPPEGVGWVWLGLPRHGGAGEVRTWTLLSGSPRSGEAPDRGELVLRCFPFTTTG